MIATLGMWSLSSSLLVAAAEPLLLTPLIKAGKLEEARESSQVQVNNGTRVGHSGYFSVPSASGKNTNNFFFWFQPCTGNCTPSSAPLVQWMQGGPGAPSTFGAMAEIGNWFVDKNAKLQKRCFSWCENRNCLFVDSPAMTGFSFQVNATGHFDPDHVEYTETSKDAAEQLYSLLVQFLTVWPEYKAAPYYITGESYGGNYVPWLATTVLQMNKKASVQVNLKGISVGDPVLNARVQWPTYADTLYSMGLLMKSERDKIADIMEKGVRLMDENCYDAFVQWNRVWMDDGGYSCKPHCDSFFKNMTGSSATDNELLGKDPASFDYESDYLLAHEAEFHFKGVPSMQLDEGGEVYMTMVRSGDFCQNSAELYTKLFLVGGIDVNIYSSNVDPLLGPPTTEAGIESAWEYAKKSIPGGREAGERFYAADKTIWRVDPGDSEPAGYARCLPMDERRFCYTMVRNAGHMTPSYMPRSSYDMTERFFGGHPFDNSWFNSQTPSCPESEGGYPPLAGPCGNDIDKDGRRLDELLI